VRGRVLGRAEQLTDAIAAYHRAIELRPGSPHFTVERARLLGRAGQVAEAVSSLEALRDQRPGDTWVLMSLADVAYNHDQLDACLAACATFREADPESATPLAIAGAAKCKRGELEAGLVDLKAALSRRPTYAWAHREMAKGLAGAGRWDEAILASAASLGVTGSAE
jgi:predicted Zn-dependent protease